MSKAKRPAQLVYEYLQGDEKAQRTFSRMPAAMTRKMITAFAQKQVGDDLRIKKATAGTILDISKYSTMKDDKEEFVAPHDRATAYPEELHKFIINDIVFDVLPTSIQVHEQQHVWKHSVLRGGTPIKTPSGRTVISVRVQLVFVGSEEINRNLKRLIAMARIFPIWYIDNEIVRQHVFPEDPDKNMAVVCTGLNVTTHPESIETLIANVSMEVFNWQVYSDRFHFNNILVMDPDKVENDQIFKQASTKTPRDSPLFKAYWDILSSNDIDETHILREVHDGKKSKDMHYDPSESGDTKRKALEAPVLTQSAQNFLGLHIPQNVPRFPSIDIRQGDPLELSYWVHQSVPKEVIEALMAKRKPATGVPNSVLLQNNRRIDPADAANQTRFVNPRIQGQVNTTTTTTQQGDFVIPNLPTVPDSVTTIDQAAIPSSLLALKASQYIGKRLNTYDKGSRLHPANSDNYFDAGTLIARVVKDATNSLIGMDIDAQRIALAGGFGQLRATTPPVPEAAGKSLDTRLKLTLDAIERTHGDKTLTGSLIYSFSDITDTPTAQTEARANGQFMKQMGGRTFVLRHASILTEGRQVIHPTTEEFGVRRTGIDILDSLDHHEVWALNNLNYKKLATTPGLLAPVQGAKMGRGFGVQKRVYENGIRLPPNTSKTTFHAAVDIGAKEGTPIVAPQDGIVKLTKLSPSAGYYIEIETTQAVRLPPLNPSDIQNSITLNRPSESKLRFGFAHMTQPSTLRAGQSVRQGDILGYVGMTGNATSPHLHFSVKARAVGGGWVAINPKKFEWLNDGQRVVSQALQGAQKEIKAELEKKLQTLVAANTRKALEASTVDVQKELALSMAADAERYMREYILALGDYMKKVGMHWQLHWTRDGAILLRRRVTMKIDHLGSIPTTRYGDKKNHGPVVTFISGTIGNTFARLPMQDHDTIAHQYLGGSDSEIVIQIQSVGNHFLGQLNYMHKYLKNSARVFRRAQDASTIEIKQPVVNLLGGTHFVLESIESSTSPDSPELYNVVLHFTEQKANQVEAQQLQMEYDVPTNIKMKMVEKLMENMTLQGQFHKEWVTIADRVSYPVVYNLSTDSFAKLAKTDFSFITSGNNKEPQYFARSREQYKIVFGNAPITKLVSIRQSNSPSAVLNSPIYINTRPRMLQTMLALYTMQLVEVLQILGPLLGVEASDWSKWSQDPSHPCYSAGILSRVKIEQFNLPMPWVWSQETPKLLQQWAPQLRDWNAGWLKQSFRNAAISGQSFFEHPMSNSTWTTWGASTWASTFKGIANLYTNTILGAGDWFGVIDNQMEGIGSYFKKIQGSKYNEAVQILKANGKALVRDVSTETGRAATLDGEVFSFSEKVSATRDLKIEVQGHNALVPRGVLGDIKDHLFYPYFMLTSPRGSAYTQQALRPGLAIRTTTTTQTAEVGVTTHQTQPHASAVTETVQLAQILVAAIFEQYRVVLNNIGMLGIETLKYSPGFEQFLPKQHGDGIALHGLPPYQDIPTPYIDLSAKGLEAAQAEMAKYDLPKIFYLNPDFLFYNRSDGLLNEEDAVVTGLSNFSRTMNFVRQFGMLPTSQLTGELANQEAVPGAYAFAGGHGLTAEQRGMNGPWVDQKNTQARNPDGSNKIGPGSALPDTLITPYLADPMSRYYPKNALALTPNKQNNTVGLGSGSPITSSLTPYTQGKPDLDYVAFGSAGMIEPRVSVSIDRRPENVVQQFYTNAINNRNAAPWRMRRAVPAFKLYFIEDDTSGFGGTDPKSFIRSYDDFFSYNAIKEIKLVKSRKIPADLLIIRLSNLYGYLDNVEFTNAFMDPSSPLAPKSNESVLENLINPGQAGEHPFTKFILKEGVRVAFRGGNENNAGLLERVFNGQIVQINQEQADEIIIVCQSFGTQLVGDLKGPEKTSIKTEWVDTFELLSYLVCQPEMTFFGRWTLNPTLSIGESRSTGGWEKVFTFLKDPKDDNIFAPSREFMIMRFSDHNGGFFSGIMNAFHALVEKLTRGVSAGATATTKNMKWSVSVSRRYADNKKVFLIEGGPAGVDAKTGEAKPPGLNIGSGTESKIQPISYLMPEYKRGDSRLLDYMVYRTRVWDVFKEMELRHPGWIGHPVPYGNRMTMFFGLATQPYWSRPPTAYEIQGMNNRQVKLQSLLASNADYQKLQQDLTNTKAKAGYELGKSGWLEWGLDKAITLFTVATTALAVYATAKTFSFGGGVAFKAAGGLIAGANAARVVIMGNLRQAGFKGVTGTLLKNLLVSGFTKPGSTILKQGWSPILKRVLPYAASSPVGKTWALRGVYMGTIGRTLWAGSRIGLLGTVGIGVVKISLGNPVLQAMIQEVAMANIEKSIAQKMLEHEVQGRLVPFRRYHYVSSKHHIVHNNIKSTNNQVYNAVTLSYTSNHEAAVDADGANGMATKVQKASYRVMDKDLRMGFFSYPNCRGEWMANRYAQGLLMRHMKDGYTGTLTILGDWMIRPYDKVLLEDDYTGMYGTFEVEEVVTTLSPEVGFVTEIIPDMSLYGNNIVDLPFDNYIAAHMAWSQTSWAEAIKAAYIGNAPAYQERVRGIAEKNLREQNTHPGAEYDTMQASMVNSFLPTGILSLAAIVGVGFAGGGFWAMAGSGAAIGSTGALGATRGALAEETRQGLLGSVSSTATYFRWKLFGALGIKFYEWTTSRQPLLFEPMFLNGKPMLPGIDMDKVSMVQTIKDLLIPVAGNIARGFNTLANGGQAFIDAAVVDRLKAIPITRVDGEVTGIALESLKALQAAQGSQPAKKP